MNREIVCYVEDDRGWSDCYVVSYDYSLSRRSNLKRARSAVSKLAHVKFVKRCYVFH